MGVVIEWLLGKRASNGASPKPMNGQVEGEDGVMRDATLSRIDVPGPTNRPRDVRGSRSKWRGG